MSFEHILGLGWVWSRSNLYFSSAKQNLPKPPIIKPVTPLPLPYQYSSILFRHPPQFLPLAVAGKPLENCRRSCESQARTMMRGLSLVKVQTTCAAPTWFNLVAFLNHQGSYTRNQALMDLPFLFQSKRSISHEPICCCISDRFLGSYA